MKTNQIPPQGPAAGRRDRRIAGHAQLDGVLDPYQGTKKLHDGTVCPQCGAVYHEGRWQWGAKAEGAAEELCAACRRINDHFPAGIVTLNGPFALQHKPEIVQLALHQEAAEKQEHPLNRIIAIEDGPDAVVISTTDIHLPRRIGEAVKRAFHWKCEMDFDKDGYFASVNCSPAV